MKIFFSLAILLINSSSPLFAQKQLLDKLYKNLRTTTFLDTVRVNGLNTLATKLGNTDKKKSDSLFKLSIDLTKRLNYVKGEVIAFISLANFNREIENFATSRRLLSEALQLAQKNHKLQYVVDAVNEFYRNYYADYSEDYIQQLEY